MDGMVAVVVEINQLDKISLSPVHLEKY